MLTDEEIASRLKILREDDPEGLYTRDEVEYLKIIQQTSQDLRELCETVTSVTKWDLQKTQLAEELCDKYGWREVAQGRDVTGEECTVKPNGKLEVFVDGTSYAYGPPRGREWRKVQAVVLPEDLDSWMGQSGLGPAQRNLVTQFLAERQTTCLQVWKDER